MVPRVFLLVGAALLAFMAGLGGLPGPARGAAAGTSRVLAQFTTFLDPGQPARTANIVLAAQTLNGHLILPGEVFSFNGAVGPRSAAAGYRVAPVIAGREYDYGRGGGVCQVATTLYNAVLLAGLPVVERHPHSLAVDYVDLGLDAAVSYGTRDLRFLNNTGGPLWLGAAVEENRLTVKIFATAGERPRVTVEVKTVEAIPPPVVYREEAGLPAGESVLVHAGRPGYRVAVTRTIEAAGAGPVRELVSQDAYPPQPRLVLVGAARR